MSRWAAASGGSAICSRRPRDPTHAPGVIISLHAWPPLDVVASARAEGEWESGRGWGGSGEHLGGWKVEEGGEDAEEPELEDTAADADADADTPSSSMDYTDTRTIGTPATTATTVPGSQLSSATPLGPPPPHRVHLHVAGPWSPNPLRAPYPHPKNHGPTSFGPPPPPCRQYRRRSRPPKQKQKLGGLPTSFVDGFSIPATGAGSRAAEPAEKNRMALRMLLSAPAVDAAASTPKSFADASASTTPVTSEKTREERLTLCRLVNTAFLRACMRCWARWSLTPRATGAFLCEFVVSAKKPVNGSAGGKGNTLKGKGKVLPAEEQEEEPEAFIPTHVHDVLKGKKQFDAMREDAEEFLGFFLDTIETLSAVVAGLSPTSSASASKRVGAAPSADGTGARWLRSAKRRRRLRRRTGG
ncbi:hypothetical protein B0H14DRAFT_2631521 [Mycena olivaceomarginata]|nr:hypothetical protein B0H14DRAFT_2631521 [Mycena olivaceomarginata]